MSKLQNSISSTENETNSATNQQHIVQIQLKLRDLYCSFSFREYSDLDICHIVTWHKIVT